MEGLVVISDREVLTEAKRRFEEYEMSTKTYAINEVFYSLQGEGVRAGTPNIFIRFQGCNLKCSGEEVAPGITQPVCDTEFASGRKVTLEEMAVWAAKQIGIALGMERTIYDDKGGLCGGYQVGKHIGPVWEEPWIICTGGEPALQVDKEFCDFWHQRGVKLAIETNGTIELPYDTVEHLDHGKPDLPLVHTKEYFLDWITVSPKTAEHNIRQKWANEAKYIRGYGQAIPKTVIQANHYLISPHAEGNFIHPDTINWCIKLCLENPQWRLSCQLHKWWHVR